jgi:hypothetical protein
MSDELSEGGGAEPALPVDVDVDAIVPSGRDLLRVISTRRKSLAVIALLEHEGEGEAVAEEAARLHELNVSAFALREAGPAMQSAARATKTVPSLCLAAIAERQGAVLARYHGADGVCVDARLSPEAWDRLAKGARTTRMLALALAEDQASVQAAVKAGARAVLVRAPSVEAARELAGGLPRGTIVVADVASVDAAGLRALLGQVDAAVIPPAVHRAPDFEALVGDLDP